MLQGLMLLLAGFSMLAGAPPAQEPEQVADPSADPMGDSAAFLENLLVERDWPSRLERDAKLGFTARSAQEAVRALDAAQPSAEPRLGPWERAAALVAIGCAKALEERPRLAAQAAEGEPLTRRAAIFALGELGGGGPESLTVFLRDPDRSIARAALLALLVQGNAEGRRLVEDIAADGGHPLQLGAREVLEFVDRPERSGPTETTLLYLELRWQAARRFALVGGQHWEVHLLEEICADEELLDYAVLLSAAELNRPGVDDHILEILLGSRGQVPVRAAFVAMPDQLVDLARNSLWAPAGPEEWDAFLDAVDRLRLELEVLPLLRDGLALPDVNRKAAALLLRAGVAQAAEIFLNDLSSPVPDVRVAALDYLGGSGDPKWAQEGARARDDSSPEVRAAGLVTMLRLGRVGTADDVVAILDGPEDPERTALVEALSRLVRDAKVRALLEIYFPRTRGYDRVRIGTALLQRGSLKPRTEIRAALRLAQSSPLAAEIVQALGRAPQVEDLELLAELFPAEGPRALNRELARALVRNSQAEGVPILRAALWSDDWNRSILAGALLMESQGTQALIDELDAPPKGVGDDDLRRVGFALGTWGGIREVELLARRRRASDPALQGAYLGALAARTF